MKKLFFALITSFIFVATAWGQCTGVISSSEYELDDLDYKEFTISEDIYKKIKFQAKKEGNWAGSTTYALLAYVYDVDGNEIGTKRIENGDLSKSSWKDFEIVSNNNKYIRKIKFQFGTIAGGLGTKLFRNVEGVKDTKLIIPTDDVNFGSIEESNTLNKSINIDFSALESALTASVGTSNFVLNTTTIAKADCSHGTATLNITFKPTAIGAYSDVITFSNGTQVHVYGECSKRVCTTLDLVKTSYTSAGFKWAEVDDPDLSGYQIVNQTTGAISHADKDKTSLNVTGLEMGKTYSFVIFPLFNGVKSLCASNEVSVTTDKTDKIVDCLIYTSEDKDNNEQDLIASDAINDLISYDIKSGNSNSLRYTKRVTFKLKWDNWLLIPPSMGGRGDLCLYVKVEGEDDFREEKYWSAANVSLTKEYQEFSATIPHNTTAIEFRTGLSNGAAYRYIKDLRVYKDFILESPISELDFGEVEPNVTVSKTFDITYAHDVVLSEIAYDNAMKTIIGDGLGHYKVEYDQKNPCAEGSQAVKVTFTPTNCTTDYNATLTLLNGETVEVKLKGTLKRNPGTVNEITWTGAADTNWDNRANWKKADDNVLSVADVLGTNLKVNIPAGLAQYPVIPDVSTAKAFKEDRDKACDCTQVNAGDNATATMIADKIYMGNGASLVGVETLNKDVPRYSEVEMEFTARRHDWLLVGSVVKPWDEANSGETRNVKSGDYFLYDMPHVYMHKAEAYVKPNDEIEVSWFNSFPSLEVEVNGEEAFAIRVPDQYGRNLDYLGMMKLNKLPAEVYNSLFLKEGDTPYDGNAPHTYTFKGRFYNENSLPTYTLPGNKQPIILSNTYPANIDGQKLQTGLDRTIYYYDAEEKSFKGLGPDNKTIMAQHSFVVVSGDDVETIEIKKEWFETSGTEYRNTSATIESFRVEITNNITSSASDIYVCYDDLKDEEANNVLDAPKIFNKMETSLADLYIIGGSKKWSGLVVPTLTEPIALGINVNSADQSFTFSLKKSTLSADVILEDRFTNTKYNLSEGEICLVEGLQAGACEGRFYLLLAEQEVEEDPEISTDVEENLKGGIDIYSQGNSVVVSSTSDIELMQVVVSDITGRSQVYNVSGQYTQLTLPVNNGVYTISVIGDKATKVEKIKLN